METNFLALIILFYAILGLCTYGVEYRRIKPSEWRWAEALFRAVVVMLFLLLLLGIAFYIKSGHHVI